MKLSKAFWQTHKEIPNDAEIVSHQLLVRAGLISKASGGIYNYLPMMLKSLRKIENIIRVELEKIGAQEITMSVITPSELWKETGRWDKMGPQMLKITDRAGRELCVSPTNEEAVVDIFRKSVQSYKQLPVNLFQINTKFRDEIRPRFGLMRGREFLMKDGYSFHLTKESLDETYNDYYKAYVNIFHKMGLEFIVVEADGGAIAGGNAKTHEFQVVANSGEDLVVTAPEIGYAANIEKATTLRGKLSFEPIKSLDKIDTPNKKTIEEVASFLSIPEYQTIKSLVLTGVKDNVEKSALFLLLGDDEVNEVKVCSYWGVDHIRPATQAVLEEHGLVAGYIGPLNLKQKIEVIYDSQIEESSSFVIGANSPDSHFSGFVISRDLKGAHKADIRLAKADDFAFDGKSKVVIKKGIEVGHIFQLGDIYSKAMQANVTGVDGRPFAPLMGCYGIGVTRCLQAAVEQNNDEDGITWPKAIAPFQVYFAYIGKSEETKNLVQKIYNDLTSNGIEVLLDDRGMGPGPMFKDSDLLGLPLRLVFGERDFQQTQELELKFRRTKKVLKIKLDDLVLEIKKALEECP